MNLEEKARAIYKLKYESAGRQSSEKMHKFQGHGTFGERSMA